MSQSTFVKSTLILTVATLLSKILGSVFRIPLQNIAGDEVLGIFSLVYPVYMVALYLSVAGIPLAISKLIAEANTRGEAHKIHKIYRTAGILAVCFGVLSFTFIFALSGPIADMLGGQSTRYALIVVAMTLIVAPSMAVYRGFFQGFGDMKPTAVSQVIEQLLRAVLILVIAVILVKLDYSNEIVAGGVMFGSIIGVLGSLVFLRMKYRKSPHKVKKTEDYTMANFKDYSSTILKISIPIAIGSVTMALFNFVDSFTIPTGLRASGVDKSDINYLYGIYGRGMTLVQITTVFASSIILPLVPLITKKLVEGDRAGTRDVIEQTQKMTHLISWPAATGLLALTLPLNVALFTNTEGSLMLAIINFSAVFTSLTLLGTGILQGMNAARLGAFIIVGGVIVKVVANIGLISLLGLDGAAYATLLVYVIVFIVNTVFIYRKIKFTIVTPAIIKIIVASAVMAAIIGIPTLLMNVADWSRLVALIYSIIAAGIGAAIYFILLWITKAINHDDLRKLPVIGKKIQKKYPKTQSGNTANSVNAEKASGVLPSPPKNNEPKERKQSMLKKSWLWALVIILIVAASPSLINRWQTELNSDQYEIMLPYEEIESAANESSDTIDELIESFKENGLQQVSLEPITLNSLKKNSVVTIETEVDFASLLRFSNYDEKVDTTKRGYYISVPENELYVQLLDDTLNAEKLTIGNQEFYFLPKKSSFTLTSPLGYDPVAIETIEAHGLDYSFRVPNDKDPEIVNNIVNNVIDLKTEHVKGILPAGSDLFGNGHPNRDQLIQALQYAGYYFYQVEYAKFTGQEAIGKVTDYKVIRLHSIDPNDSYIAGLGVKGQVDRAVRAVKERNIRSLFIHIRQDGDMDANIENTSLFLKQVQEKMPDKYSIGAPKLFDKVSVPSWALALLFLAGLVYMYIAAQIFMLKRLRYAAVIFMAALGAGYILLDKLVFLQAFALCIAVIAPLFAVIKAAKPVNGIGGLLLQYLKAAGITVVGIALVVSLLNGNMFYTKYEVFRGVIFVYALPILGLVIHTFIKHFEIDFRDKRDAVKKIVGLSNTPMKYWHVALLLIIAAVGFFYIGRTGNNGISFSFELTFRDWLEETLYVRPRTKEFLIGFPFFVLGLYVLKTKPLLGRIFLSIGVIGFLSIMNTFNHLHIPLDLSVIRTVYGLILGFIFGLIFIGIYKVVIRLCAGLSKRWS